MSTNASRSHGELVDATRMDDAARMVGRSAEALFGYFSRLDALRDSKDDLGWDALADRAAEAELHTRIVLSAGMDALNELNDLGLLESALRTTRERPAEFNDVTLTDAVDRIRLTFQERIPGQSWDWLGGASRLIDGVKVHVDAEDGGLRATITADGRSRVVRLGLDMPATRVSTRDFFSAGPERVFVPTSAMLAAADEASPPVAAYDAAVGGMALTREWVYRHARNAAELGPPTRTGGGQVVQVIVIVIVVVAAVATVAAAVLSIVCAGGSQAACKWSAFLGTLATVLSGSAKEIDKKQSTTLTYGTNTQ